MAAAKPATKALECGSNKSRILDAASAILLENGIGGLSVRAIAAKARVSTIGIYSHFKGKQGILDALYIQGFRYVESATQAAQEIGDPKEAMLRGASNYLTVADEHEASYRLIFGEADSGYLAGEEARAAGRRAFQSLVELTARILPAEASDQRKQQAAIQVWALLHGFVSIRHHGVQDFVAIDDWRPQILDAVGNMLDSLVES